MNEQFDIKSLTFQRIIGTGIYSNVVLAINYNTNIQYALKIFNKYIINDNVDDIDDININDIDNGYDNNNNKIENVELINNINREINALTLCDHENIVKLYGITEDENEICLITEYINGGELYDLVAERGYLNELDAKQIFYELVSVVNYLQNIGIAHRDLKPENILIDENGHIKICDFGMCNLFKKDELLSTPCGSPHYSAPELILGKTYSPEKSEAWTLGVLLFACVCGVLPFYDENIPTLYKIICDGIFSFPTNINLSPSIKHLISSLLIVDPEKRLSVSQIRRHEWLNYTLPAIYENVENSNEKNPIDRFISRSFSTGNSFSEKIASFVRPVRRKLSIHSISSPNLMHLQKEPLSKFSMPKNSIFASIESNLEKPAPHSMALNSFYDAYFSATSESLASFPSPSLKNSVFREPLPKPFKLTGSDESPLRDLRLYKKEDESHVYKKFSIDESLMFSVSPAPDKKKRLQRQAELKDEYSLRSKIKLYDENSKTFTSSPARIGTGSSPFKVPKRRNSSSYGIVECLIEEDSNASETNLEMTAYDDIIAISDQTNNQFGPSLVSQPRTVPTRASSPNFLIVNANHDLKPGNDPLVGRPLNTESQATVFKDTYLNRPIIGESPSKFISSRLSTTKLIDSPAPNRLSAMNSKFLLSIDSPMPDLENNPLNTSIASNASGNNLSFNVSQNLTPTYTALKSSPSVPLDDSKQKACSAWFVAAEKGDSDKVEQMLSTKQVELSARGIDNWTVLHFAARKGHIKVVRVLINYIKSRPVSLQNSRTFAIINAVNKNFWTPLMMACAGSYSEVAELLLHNGADVYIKNNQNQTALDLTADPKLRQLILQVKAALNSSPGYA